MTGASLLRWVHDAADTPTRRRAAALQNARPDGRLVVMARPGLRRATALASDLLTALGKRNDVSGRGRNLDEDWALLPCWLIAEHITEVVFDRAEWLRPELAEPLLRLTSVAGATLTLATRPAVPEALEDWMLGWTETAEAWSDYVATLPDRSAPPATTQQLPFPAVPACDFPLFLATCAARLSDSDNARVVDTFANGLDATQQWLASAAVTEDAIAVHVRAVIDACVDRNEMTAVLRGAQVALFRAGWLLRVDLDRLIATTGMTRGSLLSPQTWETLRAYRDPVRGTIAVLAAHDVSVDGTLQMRVGDVAPDGRSIQADGQTVHLRAGAEVFLNALRTLRLGQGATRQDLLIARNGEPIRRRVVGDALKAAGRELGLIITAEQTKIDAADAQWLYRRGVAVIGLT